MTTITVSIPTDCITYLNEGGIPSGVDTSKRKGRKVNVNVNVNVIKTRRLPNHWQWSNRKEYQAWWYQQNREVYKARILKHYHEKKKIASKNEPS